MCILLNQPKSSKTNELRNIFFVFLFVGFNSFSIVFASNAIPQNSLSVTFNQESFAGRPQIDEQGSQYNTVTGQINFRSIWGELDTHQQILDGEIIGYLPVNSSDRGELAAPELYFQQRWAPQDIRWTLGRMIESWSELDEYWHAGVWQPLVRWDSSRPIDQGLTGLFLDSRIKEFRALVFVSGIFIPDQQAPYVEESGRLISSNRWFREPVPTIGLANSWHKVNYDIQTPPASDIVFQNSLAAQTSFGNAAWNDNSQGLFLKLSYADKPANQFHLQMDPKFFLGAREGEAKVFPLLVRQQLITFESGYKFEYSRWVISSTTEKFKRPSLLDPQYIETPLMNARYDGVVWSQSLQPFGVSKAQIDLSYIKRTDLESPPSYSLVNGDIEASTQRFLFEEMVGLRFKKNIIGKFNKRLDGYLQYVYSPGDKGEWIQIGSDFLYGQMWRFSFSGDIFGVPGSTPSNTSFISRYRGNDRVMGSLTYVF